MRRLVVVAERLAARGEIVVSPFRPAVRLALLLPGGVRLHRVVRDPLLLRVDVDPSRIAAAAVATAVAVEEHLRRRAHRRLGCVLHDRDAVGEAGGGAAERGGEAAA